MATTVNEVRVRRERLGLSREAVARLADVSLSSVELIETGWRPRRSRVIPAVMAALARAEAERWVSDQANEVPAIHNGDLAKLADAGGGRGIER